MTHFHAWLLKVPSFSYVQGIQSSKRVTEFARSHQNDSQGGYGETRGRPTPEWMDGQWRT